MGKYILDPSGSYVGGLSLRSKGLKSLYKINGDGDFVSSAYGFVARCITAGLIGRGSGQYLRTFVAHRLFAGHVEPR
jgi:hypothetical protein